MTGAKNHWGGLRPNSGRKPAVTISEAATRKLLNTADKFAKEHGEDIDDILLSLIHKRMVQGEKVSHNTKVTCIKLVKDLTQAKFLPESDTDKELAKEKPIWLPEEDPDPAKVTDIKKGKGKDKGKDD
jgi:hypothetical protein